MAFTYSISTDRGKVRLRIGDTREQNWSLTDAEVDAALDVNSNVDAAAVIAHEWFMARLADYISTSAGGQSHQLQQRYDYHDKYHKDILVPRANKGTIYCYAGGVSQDRIDDSKDDEDYPQPFARVGADDYYSDTSDDLKDD